MSFFKKLISGLFGSTGGDIKDRDGLYLYIQCNKCGTPVRIRVNKFRDFQLDYDTGERFLRKEVMDGGCFSLMYASIRLNSAYKIIDQEVEGGEFISWEEYNKLTQKQDSGADAE